MEVRFETEHVSLEHLRARRELRVLENAESTALEYEEFLQNEDGEAAGKRRSMYFLLTGIYPECRMDRRAECEKVLHGDAPGYEIH